MREIKFKAKAKHYNPMIMPESGWVDGFYYEAINDVPFIKNSELDWEIIPETLGQYTGLKDKNGNEIYEGDIIRLVDTDYTDSELVGYIDYIIESGGFTMIFPSFTIRLCGYITDIAMDIVIIGNIHDDPKLIKQE